MSMEKVACVWKPWPWTLEVQAEATCISEAPRNKAQRYNGLWRCRRIHVLVARCMDVEVRCMWKPWPWTEEVQAETTCVLRLMHGAQYQGTWHVEAM